MTTISSSTTVGIMLTSPPDVNPIVVNSGVSVSGPAYAIYAGGGSWTIENSGAISSTVAIDLQGGGLVSNATSGSIRGNLVGVAFYNSAGTVVNSGGISATNATFGRAVYLDGGAVTNAASASIRGGSTGTSAMGVDLGAAGSVTNGFSATIAAARFGVYVTSGAGTVVNAGTILGFGTIGVGVELFSAGSVTNAASASVKGSFAGVAIYNGAGTVVNSGSISATNAPLGFGVLMKAGGSVTNAAPATISGSREGVGIYGAAGTVVNSGAIAASNYGVDLGTGGSVTNAAHALISAGNQQDSSQIGVFIYGAAGTVVNSGTVSAGSVEVQLNAGGSVTNAAAALMSGAADGVVVQSAIGTVVNSGTITATQFGVALDAGGSVTNAASASIIASIVAPRYVVAVYVKGVGTVVNSGAITGGSYGIELLGGGTVTNAGTITGSNGTAVIFVGTGSDLVVIDQGAVFNGIVAASLGASNAIELASGGSTGSLSGLGTSFTNFGSVTVDSGAAWKLTGSNTIPAGGTLLNRGSLTLSGATMSDLGSLVNSGAMVLDPSTLTVTNLIDSGSIAVDSGSTLRILSGTIASGGTVEVLDGGSLSGSFIDNGSVIYDISGGATFGGTLTGSGTLLVSGGGHLTVTSAYTGAAQIDDTSTLEFSSTYVGAVTFSGSPTGSGGTLKLDVPSTGPINVVNSNDVVIAQPGSNNWINAAVSYTLPANIDALFLNAGAQGTGNSDASGDALYALDAVNTQTLTGNSANDTFAVYNSSDVVVPKAASHDTVYAAVSYTLPTGVDTLILEAGTQGTGNSDAAGDALWAANPGQVATLTGNSANDAFVVYNSSDVVVPKAASHDTVYAAASYTLPTGVDVLYLEAGTQGTGNSDAAGDALYAANGGIAQTLTGNSANDVFVVYNSSDVVVPKASSHDVVYAGTSYTLPTGVDVLYLEAGTQGAGNSDVAGDALYAANAGIAQTLTGHSHNDTFVLYNAGDAVVGQAGSTDTVYAAANFTLPTNVDTLFLEGNASHGTGNSDAADALFGNAGGASTLVAGSGADTLYVAGTAGTVMTGGTGHDTFAFPNVMGHDEVTNFGVAKDTLQFNATLFANFTAAMNHASQVGANTVFTIDANDTVTLDSITKTSLTSGNFHFT